MAGEIPREHWHRWGPEYIAQKALWSAKGDSGRTRMSYGSCLVAVAQAYNVEARVALYAHLGALVEYHGKKDDASLQQYHSAKSDAEKCVAVAARMRAAAEDVYHELQTELETVCVNLITQALTTARMSGMRDITVNVRGDDRLPHEILDLVHPNERRKYDGILESLEKMQTYLDTV